MEAVAHIDSPLDLGRVVQQRRNRRGITQRELAELAGVSRSFVIHLESNHPRAEFGKVLAVLTALDIALAALDNDTGRAPAPVWSQRRTPRDSGAPQSTEDAVARPAVPLPQYYVGAVGSGARAQSERRAASLKAITSAWEDGSLTPTAETRDIVNRYIHGVDDLGEAVARVRKLAQRKH